MKIRVALFFLFAVACSAGAQTFLPEQLNCALLKKNNVHTVTITEKSLNPDDPSHPHYSFVYATLVVNRLGQVETETYRSGVEVNHYTYDANGNVVKIVFSDSTGKTKEISRFTYDAQNRKTEQQLRDYVHPANSANNKFVWSESGKLLDDIRLDTNGNELTHYHNCYDEHDSLRYVMIRIGNTESTRRVSDNRTIRRVFYDYNGKFARQERSVYDSLGRVAQRIDSTADGRQQTSTYTYDQEGLLRITDVNGNVLYDRGKATTDESLNVDSYLLPRDPSSFDFSQPIEVNPPSGHQQKHGTEYYRNGLVKKIYIRETPRSVTVREVVYGYY